MLCHITPWSTNLLLFIVSSRTRHTRFKCDSSSDVCSSFFFSSRRRHTRFKCDWSSDVCSSDLTSAGMSATCIVDQVELARHHPLIPGPLVVSDRNGGCLIGTLGRAA